MSFEQIKKLDDTYIAHTYARYPVALDHGSGAICYDDAGKSYIDFTSGIGVNALGFADAGWVAAVTAQLHKLQHISNLYYTEPCVQAAKLLCEKSGMKKVFFGNSGAEANEGVIKAARKYSYQKYGKGRSTITNALRLLDLGDDVIAMLNAGELTAGHARALLSLKDKTRERELAGTIVSGGLSVRAAEDWVKKENRAAAAAAESAETAPELGLEIDYYAELEKKAMGILGRRVKISHRGISKHITVSYEDNEDLEILLTKLCGSGIIES